MTVLTPNYWVVSCRKSEGTSSAKLIRVCPAYTGQTPAAVLSPAVPNHFDLLCQHCGKLHDYYKAQLQLVSLPKVHSNTLPKVNALP
jgi:hypothetical protein